MAKTQGLPLLSTGSLTM